MGLGVFSRHRRSRVSSPAHSMAVTSPNSATCVRCLQHCRGPLRSCTTSARGGARRAQGEAGLPLRPVPSLGLRALRPGSLPEPTPSPHSTFVSTCICPSSPGSAASAPTAAVSKPGLGPGPSRETRVGGEGETPPCAPPQVAEPPQLSCPSALVQLQPPPLMSEPQASPELLPPQSSTLMLHCRSSPPPLILAVRDHRAEPHVP